MRNSCHTAHNKRLDTGVNIERVGIVLFTHLLATMQMERDLTKIKIKLD